MAQVQMHYVPCPIWRVWLHVWLNLSLTESDSLPSTNESSVQSCTISTQTSRPVRTRLFL